jgi:hypothetical protein
VSDQEKDIKDLWIEQYASLPPYPLEKAMVLESTLLAYAENIPDKSFSTFCAAMHAAYSSLVSEILRMRKLLGESTSYSLSKAIQLAQEATEQTTAKLLSEALAAVKKSDSEEDTGAN